MTVSPFSRSCLAISFPNPLDTPVIIHAGDGFQQDFVTALPGGIHDNHVGPLTGFGEARGEDFLGPATDEFRVLDPVQRGVAFRVLDGLRHDLHAIHAGRVSREKEGDCPYSAVEIPDGLVPRKARVRERGFIENLGLLRIDLIERERRDLILEIADRVMDNIGDIESAQTETADAFTRLVRRGSVSFSGVSEVDAPLKRLAIGGSLNSSELLRISVLLENAARAKAYGRPENADDAEDSLTSLFSYLEPLSSVSSEIRRCVLSEDEISDDASPALRQIRRSIAGAGDRIHSTLNSMVSVKDRGIGISKASLPKIWDRFYKSDQSRGKDKKGTGLGLAIVKEIIQAHGENINAVSTEGVGTEFIFTLPLGKEPVS